MVIAAAMSVLLCRANESLDILVVGDFGWTLNMTGPNRTFNAMDRFVSDLKLKGGKVDFIFSMGDNLYVENETDPTQQDVDTMMSLFTARENLRDLNVWAIRGNHDCTNKDTYFEVNITKRYPTWRMPDLYYSRTFPID